MESDTVIRSGTKVGGKEVFAETSEVVLNNCKFDNEKSIMLKPKGGSALTESLDINKEL